MANNNLTPEQKEIIQRQRLKTLILIVLVAALVWGLVGSVDLFIVSALQKIFPTRTKLVYSVIQILVYLLLLIMIIFITDTDVSTIFTSTAHMNIQV